MAEKASLVAANIHFLEQGIQILDDIDNDLYVNSDSSCYKSSVGQHIRHVLELYLELLSPNDGKVDYAARNRDKQIENDRTYAISLAQRIIDELSNYTADPGLLDQKVWIKNNEGDQSTGNSWHESCYGREFQFLVSHTVHHYALIAIILRIQGYTPDEKFGIAPSTLRYQKQRQEKVAE